MPNLRKTSPNANNKKRLCEDGELMLGGRFFGGNGTSRSQSEAALAHLPVSTPPAPCESHRVLRSAAATRRRNRRPPRLPGGLGGGDGADHLQRRQGAWTSGAKRRSGGAVRW